MSRKRVPRFLLTNDDGPAAPGLAAMLEALARRGEVCLAVPAGPCSAIGHAVTLHKPIASREIALPGATRAVTVSGTPADAVKLALTTLWRRVRFDLCVSGVNDGQNVGVNVLYSGTVGAALEAAIAGLPGLAVSLERGRRRRRGFRAAAELAGALSDRILAAKRKLPSAALNVNVPDRPAHAIRGLRGTRQGTSGFRERYRPEGKAKGRERRWRITGRMRYATDDLREDAAALRAGYVSVTPLSLSLAAGAGPADLAKALARWGLGEGVLGGIRDRGGISER